MKPELTLKLTLNKETIRRLTDSELQGVVGGATNPLAAATRITYQSSCCDTLPVSFQLTCAEA